MQPIDWLVMVVPIIAVACIALYVRRFVKSVVDFMAGGRNAGRYLLCTAKSGMGAGAVSYVAGFEVFSHGGFSYNWWNQIAPPLLLLLTISGFVIYRYRETRALTLAQFFEMRYSRHFRIFAGILGFFAGLVNFGVMPLVNGKFMAYFLGFPETTHLFGHAIPTYVICMAANLTLTSLITMLGGQITVLVADCTEGLFSQMSYVLITVVVVGLFSWPEARHMLMSHTKGQSMVNPFDSFAIKDFNIWFVIMSVLMSGYTTMAWQNQHAFNSSGSSPHEARMGGILGSWRGFAGEAMKYMLVLFALCYLSSSHGAATMNPVLGKISSSTTREQMSIPIALSQALPMGIRGLFVAVILMGVFAADGMQLHSWSSIFIQDVVMPLRKTPLSPGQHLRLLRLGVVGVALVVFLFGVFFDPAEYMMMWWALTEAIFTGGAGACIIGGLYWSRGTSTGAWTGMLVGSILSFGGLLVRQMYSPLVTHWMPRFGLGLLAQAMYPRFSQFPLNPRTISFYAAILASLSYVVVSLLTCRKPHNMDRLLHRGEFAGEGDTSAAMRPAESARRKRFNLYKLLGITEQFTRGDRFIALGIFGWQLIWLAVFVVGSLTYLFIYKWSDHTWTTYWVITSIYVPLFLGVVTAIWFTVGVTGDLRAFFRRLKEERIDSQDDGTVEKNQQPSESLVPVEQ